MRRGRFRAINEEVARFDLGMALEDTIGGVFVDGNGAVKAVWAAYCVCSPASPPMYDEELYEQFEVYFVLCTLYFILYTPTRNCMSSSR